MRPVGGHPTDGRPPGGRPGGDRLVAGARASVPPPVVGRRVIPRTPTAERAPLVARPDLVDRPQRRVHGRPRQGRARTFVQRYGWRAYAIPLLTIATIAVLLDLARTPPTTAASDTTRAASTAPPAELAVPTVDPVPTAPAQGDAGPSVAPQVLGEETYVEKGAGRLSVVDGSSPVHGSGPLMRFIVEVEEGIEVDGAGFAAAVEATLGDPRSWGSGGRRSFQRVGAAEALAGQFDFKVSLVSPGSMETYCPGVGTGGYTSCRYGDRAVINLARWATAVPDYQGDVATYRLYVVNHEVGHVLGSGHEACPGTGQIAPVMQQQTLGLDGCVKNAWPYP